MLTATRIFAAGLMSLAIIPLAQAQQSQDPNIFEGIQGFGSGNGASTEQAQPDQPVTPKVERVKNPVAEFSGIDKITGRIISFDVYVDETVQFGALQVTPRVCFASPENQEPKTDAFVEVDEITLDRKIRRIFTGWMFAESPGLNAVEHPVYDVWLKACKKQSDIPPPESASNSSAGN